MTTTATIETTDNVRNCWVLGLPTTAKEYKDLNIDGRQWVENVLALHPDVWLPVPAQQARSEYLAWQARFPIHPYWAQNRAAVEAELSRHG